MSDYISNIEKKFCEQIKAQKVGFLLGAGSSYLNGTGYPLAASIWDSIAADVPAKERNEIQTKLDGGAKGIEAALDLLDTGGAIETSHRYCVIKAISNLFQKINPPLDLHRKFVAALSHRNDKQINVFSLNYDPLIERSCDYEHIRLFDGFQGNEHAFFDPGAFSHDIALVQISGRGMRTRRQIYGPLVRLVKLHGSLGWYDCPINGIRRMAYTNPVPSEVKHLMIPPQRRKAIDTIHRPYTTLWSEFKSKLVGGPDLINRLIVVGYGMADEHVNDVIEQALSRTNFILIIVAKGLSDEAFSRWSAKRNIIIINEDRCSHYGAIGEGHPSFWSFEKLVEELSK